jgi:hypothetical protein
MQNNALDLSFNPSNSMGQRPKDSRTLGNGDFQPDGFEAKVWTYSRKR